MPSIDLNLIKSTCGLRKAFLSDIFYIELEIIDRTVLYITLLHWIYDWGVSYYFTYFSKLIFNLRMCIKIKIRGATILEKR